MLYGIANDVFSDMVIGSGQPDPLVLRQKLSGNSPFAETLELHPSVQIRHGVFVDGSPEGLQSGDENRCPLGQFRPVNKDGTILGEMGEVVRELTKAQLANLGIRSVEVGHLNHAFVECLVGQSMLQTTYILVRQSIPSGQGIPAVGPFHEFIAESQGQVRMIAQIADAADTEFGGQLLLHPDDVRVVEPQRGSHAESEAA